MGALNFFAGDLYPNMSKQYTRTEVQPEAQDRVAMTDAPEARTEIKNEQQTPKKKIFMAIALIAIIGFVLGALK